MSTVDRPSRWASEAKVYLLHVAALFRPSTAVPVFGDPMFILVVRDSVT